MKGELGTPTPIEEAIKDKFAGYQPQMEEYSERASEEEVHTLDAFTESFATKGLVFFYGTKIYEQHMEKAGQNAFKRPFGIETATLMPSLKLVLYPTMIFKPTDEELNDPEVLEMGWVVKTQGPQTMLYFLDEFLQEPKSSLSLAASILFVGKMTQAHLTQEYPLKEGERSPQFLSAVAKALELVKAFVGKLTAEEKEKLTPQLKALSECSAQDTAQFAKSVVYYQTEPIKERGIIEDQFLPLISPESAIANKTTLLHCSERFLPRRGPKRTGIAFPAPPWVEYTTNTYNRDYQLYGRYEFVDTAGTKFWVDYLLDTKFFPGKYGFFSTLEIIRTQTDGKRSHIIIGQEAEHTFIPSLMHPVVLAGEMDFSDPGIQKPLEHLVKDKGVKREIALVLRDVLTLDAQGNLPHFV